MRELLAVDSALRRAMVSVAGAFLLIGGLLAMHTLSVAHDMGQMSDTSTAMVAPVGHHADMTEVRTAAPSVAGPMLSMGDASTAAPAPMPSHSMLMVACILALIAGVIAIAAVASTLASHLGAFLIVGAMAQVRAVMRHLPPPRPPSIYALSIIRT
jgi:hypothetical protein